MEIREMGPMTKWRLLVSPNTILGVPYSISLIRVPYLSFVLSALPVYPATTNQAAARIS
jgi:hypothetical protein